jgi:AcrR family transcriptional regulator
MLDAAERLLRTGGPEALTVEAVIEQAETSTGSFYARFGSREGLFVAMHERFLTTFGEAMVSVIDAAQRTSTVDDAVHTFVDGLFTAVRRHRDTLAFHMLHNAHDPTMRAQGNEFTRELNRRLGRLITHHPTDRRRVSPTTIDMASRTLLAMCIELVLFEDDEVTGRAITPRQFTDRFTALLSAAL